MKRVLACAALLAFAATAQAQPGPEGRPPEGGPPGGRPGRPYANPSAAIAAEIAFARLAQEKGQWTAFKATAAPDAVMFTPTMVLAQAWLKDRANPPVPLTWKAYRVWSSCDGSVMVTTGGWQRSGKQGWFTTVWQRQEKGDYKWVLDHGDETKESVAEPEMIAAQVAECPERRAGDRLAGPPPAVRGKPPRPEKAAPVPFDPAQREGRSKDGSLTWRVTVDDAGSREFTAQMMTGGKMEEIRNERVSGG